MAGREQHKVNQKLVLFDGVCNLCNATVQMLIRLDRHKKLKFASLQSETGQQVLQQNQFDQENFKTFLYVRGDEVFTRSTAALKVFSDLGGIWKAVKIFYIVPESLRNSIYDFVSQNRYKWFGQKDQCMVPTPELKDRFLG